MSESARRLRSRARAQWLGALGVGTALASFILVLSTRVQYHSPANKLFGRGTCIPDPEYKVNLALNVVAAILVGFAGAQVSRRRRILIGSAVFVATVSVLETVSLFTWDAICQEVGEG